MFEQLDKAFDALLLSNDCAPSKLLESQILSKLPHKILNSIISFAIRTNLKYIGYDRDRQTDIHRKAEQ